MIKGVIGEYLPLVGQYVILFTAQISFGPVPGGGGSKLLWKVNNITYCPPSGRYSYYYPPHTSSVLHLLKKSILAHNIAEVLTKNKSAR